MREGDYGKDLVPVVRHALDIPERVKELDPHYFIVLNTRRQRYEIHYGDGDRDTLECVLPYDQLDERTIRHLREHRMERLEALRAEVEAHNRRLEEEARKKWLGDAAERTREAVNYLKNKMGTDEIPKELMER